MWKSYHEVEYIFSHSKHSTKITVTIGLSDDAMRVEETKNRENLNSSSYRFLFISILKFHWFEGMQKNYLKYVSICTNHSAFKGHCDLCFYCLQKSAWLPLHFPTFTMPVLCPWVVSLRLKKFLILDRVPYFIIQL